MSVKNRKNSILDKIEHIEDIPNTYDSAILAEANQLKKMIPEAEQKKSRVQSYLTKAEKEEFLKNIPSRNISESDMIRQLILEYNHKMKPNLMTS